MLSEHLTCLYRYTLTIGHSCTLKVEGLDPKDQSDKLTRYGHQSIKFYKNAKLYRITDDGTSQANRADYPFNVHPNHVFVALGYDQHKLCQGSMLLKKSADNQKLYLHLNFTANKKLKHGIRIYVSTN